MELHYLEIFNTVARVQNYRKASDMLHISQPALSTEIKRLEDQLGLKLFDRTGNRLTLNQNGSMLQQYTTQIFGIMEDMKGAVENAKGFVGGTLNIGASNTPGTYLLPTVMAAFQKQYPDTRFNVTVAATEEISEMTRAGALDFAINGGKCQYSRCVCVEKLLDDRLVLAASPQNPLVQRGPLQPKDLQGAGFIVHKPNSQLYNYYIGLMQQCGLPEHVVMSLGNIDAIKNAVMAGVGIALVPEIAVRNEVCKGLLCLLDESFAGLEYPYSLIYNKNRAVSATALRFMEFSRSYLHGAAHVN
ncbi:MAG: LysR family transcriptional regulator [Faecalibacterium sp.]|jgi:DNA-binding transcriptional LysR family regulator|nr:LysR family transcriptional regulator [Faecalibacterium sp.]